MADVINTGGGDSGAGLLIGTVIAIALIILGYFVFVQGGFVRGSNAPNVSVNVPSAPAVPGQ